MRSREIVADGWTLRAPTDADIDYLMRWFPDARSVDIWSGPKFRFPFTLETFHADCRIDGMSTFCLKNPDGKMRAFGQVYDRNGRGHLARLITHPQHRGEGIGKRLIAMLMTAARQLFDCNEWSLFVYRHNEPAYRCYLAMGFTLQAYPEDAALRDKCYFLTRAADS